MLIPHLHFCGDCEKAIALYEKAFQTKAESVIHNYDYDPAGLKGDHQIAHAVMYIHGQKIFLNDRFGNKGKSQDFAIHLIVTFPNAENLLSCYSYFKEGSTMIDPFIKLPYSELAGNFIDQFGVQWGFMVE